MPQARFPKSARLLKHADFDHVYKNGKRQFSGHMTLFFLPRESGAPRVGFTVGRVLGGAVDRNRIKRRLREAVRHQLPGLAVPVDVVVNPRKSVLALEFTQLEAEIAKAFERIGRESRAAGRAQETPTTETRRHGEAEG